MPEAPRFALNSLQIRRSWRAVFVATVVLGSAGALSCGRVEPTGGVGMFRGGAAHTGRYPGDSTTRHAVIEWKFSTDGAVRASPLVDADFVFIGSGDGRFYALERASGRLRWALETESAIHSSAASDGRLVFFGDRQNRFYGLDRQTGREVWRVETGPDLPWEWGHEGWDYFTSSPAVADGLVIVGSGDGHVYALTAQSGAERWRLRTGGRVRSSPAVADGVAYVGSADGFLYAVRLATGDLLWKFESEGASLSSAEFGFDRKTIQSSPALLDGIVYFGSRDGGVYAVEASTGQRLWYRDYGTPWVISSPAVDETTLYTGTSDGLFVDALDTGSGDEVWRFVVGERVFSSPSLSGSSLYVGAHDGRLLALDRKTGTLQWALHFGRAIMSSPVVSDDRLYVGADDGNVYSIRLEPGRAPSRAVYWDAERAAVNTLANHEELRDYFASFGYQPADRFQLSRLMEASIEVGDRSVIVFAMDDLPATVAPTASDTVLARRYLEAGGKIVWLGLPPLLLVRDSVGGIVAIDRHRPGVLLGVDHERYDLDQVAAYPTAEGRRWGFTRWWISTSGLDVSAVTVTLAVDENGGAPAWVKSYGGPPGSGFVQLWGTYRAIDPETFDQVRQVAEYGIGAVADAHPWGGEDGTDGQNDRSRDTE